MDIFTNLKLPLCEKPFRISLGDLTHHSKTERHVSNKEAVNHTGCRMSHIPFYFICTLWLSISLKLFVQFVLNKYTCLTHRIQFGKSVMSLLTGVSQYFARESLTPSELLHCLLPVLLWHPLSLPSWFYLTLHRNCLLMDFSFFIKCYLCYLHTYIKVSGWLIGSRLELDWN